MPIVDECEGRDLGLAESLTKYGGDRLGLSGWMSELDPSQPSVSSRPVCSKAPRLRRERSQHQAAVTIRQLSPLVGKT